VIHRVVAIGGPPGSGKSTAGRLVAEALHLEYRSAGEVFRAEAARRGLDLDAFGRYASAHLEVDRALDEAMQGLARPGMLLDGRIQGVLCRRRGVPVHAIEVTASEEERVRRVAARDGEDIALARAHLRAREASERERYRKFYEIDLDRTGADLTVDSTRTPPTEVAAAIVAFVRGHDGEAAP
jgi:CMP/dCMP kinase